MHLSSHTEPSPLAHEPSHLSNQLSDNSAHRGHAHAWKGEAAPGNDVMNHTRLINHDFSQFSHVGLVMSFNILPFY